MTSQLKTDDPGSSLPVTEPADRPPLIRQGWLRALVALLVYVAVSIGLTVLVAVGIAVVTVAGGGDPAENLKLDPGGLGLGGLAAIQLLTLVITLIVVFGMRRLVDRRSVLSLGLQLEGHVGQLLEGAVWGVAVIVVGFVGLLGIGVLTVAAPSEPTNPLLLIGCLGVLVIVAFNEELLVRGYLLTNLMDSFNRYVALAITAVVFAAFHLFNANVSALAVINLVLAGLILGITTIHSRNLWFPIGMHLTWNFCQGPVFGFEVSGLATPSLIGQDLVGPEVLTGGAFGLEGSIVATFLLAVATVVLDWRYRRNAVAVAVSAARPRDSQAPR
jgi:hypothetical protein